MQKYIRIIFFKNGFTFINIFYLKIGIKFAKKFFGGNEIKTVRNKWE
ncbi:hypothetical protein CHY_1287 [Carboxydothermus hydrogenoformans Z-2901]|uniref:Uncharacterized protein n=1 Tax=Carboxydothermus hydrogenoformans (strain ATCC BAA-161 / DSM 6008 / Z-2901) TaxID=246194 RepID=Q3ACL3_CARHZ|nr:hypothetical protein CHY_1287 [Carboxydothermus hydrogenoformans Z-2901]